MEIQILQLLDGAKKARGLTVVIDVFRAFSTACFAFDNGASTIIPVGDINIAYKLKSYNPSYILIGERNEIKPIDFDFGNSPSLLSREKINGKTLVHTTSSGTQGIAAATNASEIITGSFVNAGAIVKYIQKKQPQIVSLVCMGYACQYPTDEDTLCAEYIKNELTGIPNNFSEIKKLIRNGSGKRFFEKEKQSWSPREDFNLCLQLNRFNFILKVKKTDSFNYLKKIGIY